MPASPLRRAWLPTSPPHITRPSLPCLRPLSSRMCQGLHSYLRPYTSNTSSSSSSLKLSTAGFSHTPGRCMTAIHDCIQIYTDSQGKRFNLKCIIVAHRRTQDRIPLNPHRLRSGYEYSPPLHVPQPMTQQPRYLAEGTDW